MAELLRQRKKDQVPMDDEEEKEKEDQLKEKRLVNKIPPYVQPSLT